MYIFFRADVYIYACMYAPATTCTFQNTHFIDRDAPGVGGPGSIGRAFSHQSPVKPPKARRGRSARVAYFD